MQTEEQERKVTVGFRCDPPLRVHLTHQAEQLGVTLSTLIETRLLAEEAREAELLQQIEKVKALEERLNFFEQEPLLQNLYKTYQGKTITYIDNNNQTQNQKIETVQDVFTIIIKSFKTQKQ